MCVSNCAVVFEQFVNVRLHFAIKRYKRELSFCQGVALLPALVSQLISRLLTMSTSCKG